MRELSVGRKFVQSCANVALIYCFFDVLVAVVVIISAGSIFLGEHKWSHFILSASE